MRVFDYIFYRVTEYSIRKWHEEYPWFRGVCVVAALFVGILLDLEVFVSLFAHRNPGEHIFKLGIVVAYFVFIAFSWYRYRKIVPYEKLEEKWRDETPRRGIRNKWLSVGFILLVMSPPLVYGILKHNLHWI